MTECAECGGEVEGVEDWRCRNYHNEDGELICSDCMFEKVLIADATV